VKSRRGAARRHRLREWVGGVEDLRLGLPQIYKYHYLPGVHESSVVAELIINADVWKSCRRISRK